MPDSGCRGATTSTLAYVLNGDARVGMEMRPIRGGQLVALKGSGAVTITAATVQESRSPMVDVLLLGDAQSANPSPGTARS